MSNVYPVPGTATKPLRKPTPVQSPVQSPVPGTATRPQPLPEPEPGNNDPDGAMRKSFDQIDANKDGVLSGREYYEYILARSGQKSNRWLKMLVAAMFGVMDKDRNGQVTFEEYKSARRIKRGG